MRFDTFEFTRCEVGNEAYLFADKIFGTVMLGDARDDGTSPQSVVYFELKEFIGFGYFLALQNFSHANVELGEVVELDRRGDRFGYVVGFFVGDFGILQFFDLRFDNVVIDFLEEKFGGSQLSAGFEKYRCVPAYPIR